jgi:hypothetical protein
LGFGITWADGTQSEFHNLLSRADIWQLSSGGGANDAGDCQEFEIPA